MKGTLEDEVTGVKCDVFHSFQLKEHGLDCDLLCHLVGLCSVRCFHTSNYQKRFLYRTISSDLVVFCVLEPYWFALTRTYMQIGWSTAKLATTWASSVSILCYAFQNTLAVNILLSLCLEEMGPFPSTFKWVSQANMADVDVIRAKPHWPLGNLKTCTESRYGHEKTIPVTCRHYTPVQEN